MAREINYSKRDFLSLKQEQINYIKKYYPDVVENFNDGSILSVLLDLNAGIADNLNYHIDRTLQETVLDFAQEKKSLYNIANTYGLKLPTKAASIAVCEFSAQVPVFGDSEDDRYLPVLQGGTQVIGDGQVFELLYDVDFSSNFNSSGKIDRTKVPLFNKGVLSAYRITKTGIVVAGTTRIYTQVFDDSTPQSFYKLILPENDVLSIDSVIHKNGTQFQTLPTITEFNNSVNKWYEVNSLAESKIFVVDKSIPVNDDGLYKGYYKSIDTRFVKEYTPNGFCTLTFGGKTNQDSDILEDFLDGNTISLNSFLNNNSLGFAPFINTTMYVKYRVGGGEDSNVGIGVINSFGSQIINLSGPNEQTNAIVRGSLTVNNITPSVGGAEAPSIEEIRNYIKYNFAAQNRAVTLEDYKAISLTMPSKFGSPSRIGVIQNQNKIEINVLSVDSDNVFTNNISNVLMENLANYLSDYRMINDYVVVRPGEVIDLSFEVSVLVEEGDKVTVVNDVINAINNEFSKNNAQMGRSYYVGKLLKILANISGVINTNYLKIYNKVGGEYSNNVINQTLINSETNEINLSTAILNCDENQILQIRKPNVDINVIPVISTPLRTLI